MAKETKPKTKETIIKEYARFEASLYGLNRETIMSNTPSERTGKIHQSPKGKENGEKRKSNKDKAKGGPGARSLQQARFIITSPVVAMNEIVEEMTNLPDKPGGGLQAWTVDDAIYKLTTGHKFVCDVDLAIDVFRELKENKIEDCYGQRFDFNKFKEFVSRHPLISRGLSYDSNFRGAWFQSRKASKYNLMRKKAFREDYDKSDKSATSLYQSMFKTWLENDKGIPLKEFNQCPDSIRKTLLKDFNEPKSVLWPHKDIVTRKIQAIRGKPISKGKYERAFNNQYDNSEIGQQNIPRAYSLKYTAKVQPKRELVLDGTMSFQRRVGDFVSYEGRWSVVVTPWNGEGEFYLAKTFKLGKTIINPAYAHLLFAHPKNKGQDLKSCNSPEVLTAHRAWNSAGTLRCGWNPRRELAAIYGANTVQAFEEGLEPVFTGNGNWAFIDGRWVIPEKKTSHSKTKNYTPAKPLRGKPGKYVPKDEN